MKFVCRLGRVLQKHCRPSELLMGITSLKKTHVYDTYNCFRSGQELLQDEPCSDRLSSSVNVETISNVKEMVHANQWITSNEAVNEVGISRGSAQTILTE
jgi:response regulator of citrate/malate metabolism